MRYVIVAAACLASGLPTNVFDGASAVESRASFPVVASHTLAPPQKAGETLFEALGPEESGINVINPLEPEHPLSFLYHSGMSSGGVAIGDVDTDGKPDLCLATGPGRNYLYRQTGDLVFSDITADSGLDTGTETWSTGVSMVDIDNDGDLDIYVCNYAAPNFLYVNDGKGFFRESAKGFGLDVVDASLMGAFCDYDLDGDLDLFLLTNRWHDPDGFPKESPARRDESGKPYILPSLQKYYGIWEDGPNWAYEPIGTPDRLFRNEGDGTFSDVTSDAGIEGQGDGLSATWWDYNSDGFPDIYVGNDFSIPDHLFHNNGDGTFQDVLAEVVPHSTWFSMGADVADLNNDGLLDFLIADMSSTTHFMEKTSMGAMSSKFHLVQRHRPPQYMRNALYLNTGTPRFMEIAYLAGLGRSDWTWAVKLADFDNDGWNDVFFSNGTARNTTDSDLKSPNSNEVVGFHMWDFYRNLPPRPETNLAFRNRGDLRFESSGPLWGLDHHGMSYATAYGDLDRDGDLDLVMANLDEPAIVYRNRSTDGNRLLISLRGDSSNRFGIGAKVRFQFIDGVQIRQLMPYTGFLSSNEPIIHFGLGTMKGVDRLVIEWPSGTIQHLEGIAGNRHYIIYESQNESTQLQGAESDSDAPKVRFAQTSATNRIGYRERPYDDFARQPLLPNKLSQLGPGVAVGDVDADGVDEIYLSSPSGESGILFRRDERGLYQFNTWDPFYRDRASEDMAPLFFDADADGDLDLYVVSGGVECEPEAEVLRDRLYLNDGFGFFSRAPEDAVPDLRDSGSVVAAGDYDRDGDLDLFVGGRVIPGNYPTPPRSRLLQNDAGFFSDATESAAPEILDTGMVTGALWTDVNADGWIDLMLTLEWGPVKLFVNREGVLADRTTPSGLSSRTGWWNSLAGADFDGDGDIDYVVTNVGLNTKYRASAEHPVLLYLADFEKTGIPKIVEAEFEEKTLYPVRGRSCSTNAIPSLAGKFKSYRAFARASLEEIYTPEVLKNSMRLAVNTLESGILINDGAGSFSFEPLPRIAQASPGFGVVASDFDGDRHCDVFIAQNFFGPQKETGRFDGGLSILLQGRGDGTFDPLSPRESGFVIPDDAKGAVLAEINGDSRPDLIVGANNAPLLAFENRSADRARFRRLSLAGNRGNPEAVGSRVAVTYNDGEVRVAEVYSGGGYLSQSTRDVFVGCGPDLEIVRIDVRWPDGNRTSVNPNPNSQNIKIRQPL